MGLLLVGNFAEWGVRKKDTSGERFGELYRTRRLASTGKRLQNIYFVDTTTEVKRQLFTIK